MKSRLYTIARKTLGAAGLHTAWYAMQSRRGQKLINQAQCPPDLVMILNEDCRGWILDGICNEISRYAGVSTTKCYYPAPIPVGRSYLVTQYTFLPSYIKANPALLAARTVVFHTHPSDMPIAEHEFVDVMNRMHRIVCMNSANSADLKARGVNPSRLKVVIGGADPDLFPDHARGTGIIGICSHFYPRKNGELILALAQSMQENQFLLVGRNWQHWQHFDRLLKLPNFTYSEAPYSDYPQLYSKMDVLRSPSKLEGGPIPLIEAMMSNVVPVATRTGFAPDIIRHGENGFLFEPEAGIDLVQPLVTQALRLERNVRETALNLSWEHFSRNILDCFSEP